MSGHFVSKFEPRTKLAFQKLWSSDPNYVFNLASSKDINVINEYIDKSPTIPNKQLQQGSENLIEFQESQVNIQVDEGTITTVEEVNKSVPEIVNNKQIQEILLTDINTIQLD